MDKDLLFFLLSIGAAIIYDITKPWIKSYWEKGSLSLRQREMEILLIQYKARKMEHSNIHVINGLAIRGITRGLLQLSILIFIIGFSALASPVGIWASILIAIVSYVGVTVIQTFKEVLNNIDDAVQFDKYKEKIKEKLIKLGGNPEDLDKEETHSE